jgi:hypothetical protein
MMWFLKMLGPCRRFEGARASRLTGQGVSHRRAMQTKPQVYQIQVSIVILKTQGFLLESMTICIKMLPINFGIFLSSIAPASAAIESPSLHLISSAVVSEPDGIARIECWQFTTPFSQYPTVNMAIPLADLSNATYVVMPPRSSEGIHNPPHVMSANSPVHPFSLSPRC